MHCRSPPQSLDSLRGHLLQCPRCGFFCCFLFWVFFLVCFCFVFSDLNQLVGFHCDYSEEVLFSTKCPRTRQKSHLGYKLDSRLCFGATYHSSLFFLPESTVMRSVAVWDHNWLGSGFLRVSPPSGLSLYWKAMGALIRSLRYKSLEVGSPLNF